MKLWCYEGLDVPEDAGNARTQHVDLKPRTLVLDITEDELDNLVVA